MWSLQHSVLLQPENEGNVMANAIVGISVAVIVTTFVVCNALHFFRTEMRHRSIHGASFRYFDVHED